LGGIQGTFNGMPLKKIIALKNNLVRESKGKKLPARIRPGVQELKRKVTPIADKLSIQ